MIIVITGSWRALAIRGAAAVLFGVAALVWPDVTLWALVALFGAFALVDGAFALAAGVRRSEATEGRQGWLIVQGLAGVAIGLATLFWPDATALALLLLIAAWAVVLGVGEIAGAVALRRELHNEWLLGLAGALSVAFGVLLAITPGDGALVITWLIGWWAVLRGALFLVLAGRIRKLEEGLASRTAPQRPATA
jgi:uncharacterized membrane protein HdeD (DUF308 family)